MSNLVEDAEPEVPYRRGVNNRTELTMGDAYIPSIEELQAYAADPRVPAIVRQAAINTIANHARLSREFGGAESNPRSNPMPAAAKPR